jgi:hypothetical protein
MTIYPVANTTGLKSPRRRGDVGGLYLAEKEKEKVKTRRTNLTHHTDKSPIPTTKSSSPATDNPLPFPAIV